MESGRFTQDPSPAPPGSAEPHFTVHDPSPPLPPSHDVEETAHRLADFGPQLDRLAMIGEELHALVRQLTEPAAIETVRLSQTRPKQSVDNPQPWRSIAVYNPNPVTLFLGIGGTIAEPNREAVTVSRNSLLVLPVGGNILELGAVSADLGAGDAIAYLFLYKTVQAAFYGSLGF